MKVLGIFLSKEIRTGGHIRCLELMEGLAERGNEVRVLLNSELAYKGRRFAEIRLEAPYRRHSIPPASAVFARATKTWLGSARGSEKPDCVIVFGESHLRSALEAKKALGIPVIFGYQSNTVRESLISLKENARRPLELLKVLVDILNYRRYEARIARSCDSIVFQNAYDRDDFLARNRGCPAKVFYLGGNIGPPRFTEESRDINRGTSLKKILFMGTLGGRKGLRYLFEAFAILRAEGRTELELHVAGPGVPEQRAWFDNYAKEHGFDGSVSFYGRVPSVFPLMAECDLMVAPSLFDSYPDVILLALHAGIPVIGSRIGGIPEMLGRDELLFPVRDGAAIASILRACLDEPGRYAKLRALCAAGRERFLFDWPEAWEKIAAESVRK
jgi:glycosyltransferase involved in cell wall biosynthesis